METASVKADSMEKTAAKRIVLIIATTTVSVITGSVIAMKDTRENSANTVHVHWNVISKVLVKKMEPAPVIRAGQDLIVQYPSATTIATITELANQENANAVTNGLE
jgi:hypothetical protein